MRVLKPSQWRPLATAHRERALTHVEPALARKQKGVRHPIEDFLWHYYSLRPSHLLHWHPGLGVGLSDAREYEHLRGYETADGVSSLSLAFVRTRADGWRQILALLQATASRPPRFGCSGLHEWAMVYRLEQSQIRHEQLPLRLTPTEIADVVDGSALICTHVDAFRFFTDPAAPLNRYQPSRTTQIELEQPGCIHANMDLYKWAYKLLPAVDSELLLDAFEFAKRARTLDMQAAPYDLSDYGLAPVQVENAEGRAEYLLRQRELSVDAAKLRDRLITQLSQVLQAVSADAPSTA